MRYGNEEIRISVSVRNPKWKDFISFSLSTDRIRLARAPREWSGNRAVSAIEVALAVALHAVWVIQSRFECIELASSDNSAPPFVLGRGVVRSLRGQWERNTSGRDWSAGRFVVSDLQLQNTMNPTKFAAFAGAKILCVLLVCLCVCVF